MMIVDDDGVVVSTYGVFVRSAYNYDKDAASVESGLKCEDASLAQQQFKEECDINNLMERFGQGAQIPQNVHMPLTEDFVETMTFHEAQNALLAAEDAFMQYPASIRERFGNDAGRFVDFVSDPANVAQAREWGLAKPAPVEAPIAAPEGS